MKDDEIPTGDRLTIDTIISKVHKGLLHHDMNYISAIAIDELSGKEDYNRSLQTIAKIELDTVNFFRNTIFECMVNNTIFSKRNQVRSDKNRFTFSFPYQRQVYIYLFTVASAIQGEKYLVSTVFFRERKTWRLAVLRVFPYSYNDRNGEDLYFEANKAFYENRLVSAFIYEQLMLLCQQPAGNLLVYDSDKAMKEIDGQIKEAITNKMHFPILAETVSGKPEIFDLRVKLSNRKGAPLIYYKTSIPLSSTSGVEKQNLELHKSLEKYFPGIKRDFDTIFYRAMNEYPNDYSDVPGTELARLAE